MLFNGFLDGKYVHFFDEERGDWSRNKFDIDACHGIKTITSMHDAHWSPEARGLKLLMRKGQQYKKTLDSRNREFYVRILRRKRSGERTVLVAEVARCMRICSHDKILKGVDIELWEHGSLRIETLQYR